MSYWWVNHSAAFKAESEGGFIWAPAKTSKGRTRVTWDNVAQVRKGDIVFGYANMRLWGVGTATADAYLSEKPHYNAELAQEWEAEGYYAPIAWVRLQQHFVPAEHIDGIRAHLPQIHSPIRPETGKGNQSCYLAAISPELAAALHEVILELDAGAGSLLEDALRDEANDRVAEEIQQSKLTKTMKEQLVLARIGQGLFRSALLARCQARCRVTGVVGADLLTASHIKPWMHSNNDERLDPHNGLLLAPHVDRLFDRGRITFAADGRVLFADDAARVAWKTWGLPMNLRIEGITRREAFYLQYHRAAVFKGLPPDDD